MFAKLAQSPLAAAAVVERVKLLHVIEQLVQSRELEVAELRHGEVRMRGAAVRAADWIVHYPPAELFEFCSRLPASSTSASR